jgi:glycine cleavage system H protein
MTNIPGDLLYSREHEWARVDGDLVVIGVTDFAQRQLGEIVFTELPAIGEAVEAAAPIGTIESVKAVSEIYAPLGGEVVEINDAIVDSPDSINDDPYGDGWLVRLKLVDAAQLTELLDAAAYQTYCQEDQE